MRAAWRKNSIKTEGAIANKFLESSHEIEIRRAPNVSEDFKKEIVAFKMFLLLTEPSFCYHQKETR